jgi:hypothetical protein
VVIACEGKDKLMWFFLVVSRRERKRKWSGTFRFSEVKVE